VRREAAALALALVMGACRHATKVGDGAARAGGKAEGGKAPGDATQAQKGVPPRGDHPRVPSSPKALLADGEIAKLQDALAGRGYLGKHEPGKLDDATTAAIRKFQKESSLAETGFPDRLTLRMLGMDPEDAYSKVKEPKDETEQRRAAEAGAPATAGGGAKGSAGEGGKDGGKR
jgi:peptidoglycan hydrolase-like protein with peptidoglycan-binding domain